MFLWAQDLHLRPRLWVSDREVLGDAYHALDQVTTIAINNKVEAVVLGGDLFHKNEIDSWSLQETQCFVARLREAGIMIYGIEGNHDRSLYVSFCSALGIMDLATLSAPVSISGMTVRGLPPMSATKIQQAVSGIPSCDVLVIHSAFQHLLGFEGAYQLRMEDIPAHIKSVFAGDVHVHSQVVSPEGVHIYSSGSTYPQRLNELSQEHGVFLVSAPDRVEFVPIRNRCFASVDWRAEEGTVMLRERLTQVSKFEGDGKLVPVALVRSATRPSPEASAGLRVIVVHVLQEETTVSSDELPVFSDEEVSLLGCLPGVLNPAENPLEYDLVASLLASPATATEQVQEFIKNGLEVPGVTVDSSKVA